MSPNGNQRPSVPGMLLRRHAEEPDREAIRNAFHGFATGDPNTFPVQFAVLLEAHATAMETAPELLKQRLGAMLTQFGDLMAAYQADVQEGLQRHRNVTDRQITELRQEVARVTRSAEKAEGSADAMKEQIGALKDLGHNRIVAGLWLAALGGSAATLGLTFLFHLIFR